MSKMFAAAPAASPPAVPPSADLRVCLRHLAPEASVGVYPHERTTTQPILLCIDMELLSPGPTAADAQEWAVALVNEGHVALIETLAERIAARCLADARVRAVTVGVEKLRVFPDVVVGVEITRTRA